MFSIVIPSWNNLPYLKLCVESLTKHSFYPNEIIVHINDGSDGSLDWIKASGIRYTHTKKNVGVCLAVNHLVSIARYDWVLYVNDDMIACPGWDVAMKKRIALADDDLALYFGTMIQPDGGKTDGIIKGDFGRDPTSFDEARMLREYLTDTRGDILGGTSQPTLVNRKWWNMVGGYSLEFSPGMSSDDDLLMKFWVIGCRNFRIVGDSRFYHFSCKSTGRIRHNKGGRTFVTKWGITQDEFYRHYIASLNQPNPKSVTGNPVGFVRGTLLGKLRRAWYGLRFSYPLADIEAWDPQSGIFQRDSSSVDCLRLK